ncbi:MAG: nitrate reductase [Paraglaciecola sp.]|nr:nitrate reductase [Paraglaciecola sp.]
MSQTNTVKTKRASQEQGPSEVSSTCPYCGVGCGVDVSVDYVKSDTGNGSTVRLSGLSGTRDHPANFGRLCVKGTQLLATNSLAGRMQTPTIDGKKASWSAAINKVAQSFSDIIATHGADSVAFYVSGQLLTEDYYVANKLMKGYIGSANIDTNSRLCMSSAVTAYKRAFGADAVPCCYEDLEETDLVVLVGSNAAWTHPVLYQRIERAKKRNPALQVVIIDPRRTASSELADLHLPIKPGTDVALFNGLLAYLSANQGLDHRYIEQHTEGFTATLEMCQNWSVDQVAAFCDVDNSVITQFFDLFKLRDRVVTAYSMGVNQSSSGVDKANAIINCHLATGKLGREGCGPFSLTGQPNAMGGREVGGLANMLACHMDLDNAVHTQLVQNYWQSPNIATKPGLKAVDLFDKILDGTVKAVWIMATNPVVSMPNRDKIIAALQTCELVVVSDVTAQNDTIDYAHVTLPATTWSEKNGTVTNSERRISRQRGILPAFAESKHDWQIVCDVAKAMGFKQGFNYQTVHEIFNEYTGLSAEQNQGSRDLDLSGISQLSAEQYDKLRPVQWPINAANPQGTKRLFSDAKFYTQTAKAQFIALSVQLPEQQCSAAFPFVLNSGRIRDQWHTMTRTGKSSELNAHQPLPTLAIHPEDAAALNLKQHDFVQLFAAHNDQPKRKDDSSETKVVLAVNIDSRQRQGEVFAPIHWSAANSSSAAIASLYSDAHDPLSGQPELKHAAVALSPIRFASQGQIFTKHPLARDFLRRCFDYYVQIPLSQGCMLTFASQQQLPALKSLIQQHFPLYDEWMSQLLDGQQNSYALQQGQLMLAMFTGSDYRQIDQVWLNALFSQTQLGPLDFNALLTGRPHTAFNAGPLICSCFKVGENTIKQAIEAGCETVEALGAKLKCGTNCGSCKSELSQLLNQYTPAPQTQMSVAAARISVVQLDEQ